MQGMTWDRGYRQSTTIRNRLLQAPYKRQIHSVYSRGYILPERNLNNFSWGTKRAQVKSSAGTSDSSGQNQKMVLSRIQLHRWSADGFPYKSPDHSYGTRAWVLRICCTSDEPFWPSLSPALYSLHKVKCPLSIASWYVDHGHASCGCVSHGNNASTSEGDRNFIRSCVMSIMVNVSDVKGSTDLLLHPKSPSKEFFIRVE